MNKTFKIIGNDISDGYHTFDELYEHRVLLYILAIKGLPEKAYVKLDHYEGWDCIYQYINGNQISYHVPVKYRDLYISECEVDNEHTYDGHTSQDVLNTIKNYCERY